MTMGKKIENMSIEELEAHRVALAEQRSALRLEQVETEEMLAYRKLTAGMPEGLRARIQLKGSMDAKGAQA
jgi:predicted DNA-binding transcriptional regulator YafY